ncbi:MAG TPA: efflux RND transporter periplasmic adaptor subunit [Tichowtungia sp.]|nr:efflux RND transporter periplasmic adaptor subunit [Tichowtungia sp.]
MSKTLKAIISISLVTLAVVVSVILVKTAPQAEKQRPSKMAPLVETVPLKAVDHTVHVKLTGTVIPADEIRLRARVSGEVVSIAPGFIDGGLLEKGAEAVRMDPVDYDLALTDAKSKLEAARFAYKQELGRQDVARREWDMLKADDATEFEQELALRKPNLAASKAALAAAEAAVEKAELNLARTRVTAPFNAIVVKRNVNVGSQASTQDVLATLVGTDVYWVQVSIPVDRLGWVNIPGSKVTVESNSGAVREGTVIKLLADLEERGRMARLLIEMKNPLDGELPILLGEYVRVDIAGRELKEVYVVPRTALREGSLVWIVNEESKLEIRKEKVLWRDENQVVIRDGFADGDRMIVSDLNFAIDGMDVSTGKSDKPQNTQNTQKEKIDRKK